MSQEEPIIFPTAAPKEPAKLCSICNRRKARDGKDLCSRCTVKGRDHQLRSVLPGMVVENPNTGLPQQTLPVRRMVPLPSTPQELPHGTNYTRKEVALKLGIKPQTIKKWEDKGRTKLPLKHIASGKVFYTEEHVQELIEFSTRVEHRIQINPSDPHTQQSVVAHKLKGFTKMGRGIDKTVSKSLGRSGLFKFK